MQRRVAVYLADDRQVGEAWFGNELPAAVPFVDHRDLEDESTRTLGLGQDKTTPVVGTLAFRRESSDVRGFIGPGAVTAIRSNRRCNDFVSQRFALRHDQVLFVRTQSVSSREGSSLNINVLAYHLYHYWLGYDQ